MNLNQINYFLQICKDKSFSKASEGMHITQQALSKSIAILENELDLQLFNRTKNGITLTKYGLVFRKHCEIIINEVGAMQNQMQKMHNYSKCNQTINLQMAFGMAYFIPLDTISLFQEKYPYFNLKISENINLECEKNVLSGSIDAAITIGPFDKTEFTIVPLASYDIWAIVNSRNKLAQNETIDFKELKNHPLISLKYKSSYYLIDQCKKAGFKPNIIFLSSDVATIISLCTTNNRYIGFGAEHILNSTSPNPNVRFIPIKDGKYKRDICLITKKNKSKLKYLKTFISFIQQTYPRSLL